MKTIMKNYKGITICTMAILICSVNIYAKPGDSAVVKMRIYHICKPLTLSIIGIGTFSDYFAIGRIKGKAEITNAEIQTLNPDLLNPIDKWALQQNSSPSVIKTFQFYSDNFQVPVFMLPGLLLFNKHIRRDWFDILLMYIEGHVVTFTFYNYSWLGPTFQNKYRPMTYYTGLPIGDRTTGNNRNSFYSGHVASVSYASFFTAKVYCDYHPELGAKKALVYLAASVPPIIESYLRVRSLAHFPSDDMVGFFLGASLGVAIPEFHRIKIRNLSMSLFSSNGATGVGLTYRIPGQSKSGLH